MRALFRTFSVGIGSLLGAGTAPILMVTTAVVALGLAYSKGYERASIEHEAARLADQTAAQAQELKAVESRIAKVAEAEAETLAEALRDVEISNREREEADAFIQDYGARGYYCPIQPDDLERLRKIGS